MSSNVSERIASAEERASEVLEVLHRSASQGYIGEDVSQLDHALQAAFLASKSGDDEQVLAALLHDIGHLLYPEAPSMDGLGTVDHEVFGHNYLQSKGFSSRVARLVKSHVQAKRYLATRREGYLEKLSEASLGTLQHQGGPMSLDECRHFEAQEDVQAILALRVWDERAKDPNANVPELENYRDTMLTHLRVQEARDLSSLMERPLSAQDLEVWEKKRILVLPRFFKDAELNRLAQWVEELSSWPEKAGHWMKYFEPTKRDPRQLCRVENFLPYHEGLSRMLKGPELMNLLAQLMGEEAVLFKEKVNYKLPGGAGFTAHQDAPAFLSFGQRFHITVLITVDNSTQANGGLEFSESVPMYETLKQAEDGTVHPEVESEIPWEPVDLPAGSLVFFDSYIPHRSPSNQSQDARRALYITYNRLSEGSRRDDYYRDKREKFPPEIEREEGRDYSIGSQVYNLGNPIR